MMLKQLILVDGNGVLHPNGFGCASHIGVLANIPTIGVAKDLQQLDGLEKKAVRQLCADRKLNFGESVPLVGESGRTWGAALRSSHPPKGSEGSFNPIYVSIGHSVCLGSALALVKACCRNRIPEPVRLADLEGRDFIRAMEARGEA